MPKTDVVFQTLFETKGNEEILGALFYWSKMYASVIIFKNLEIHIIELPKIKKYPEETEKELKRWMEFLINPESEVVKLGAKEDKALGEAMEKLEYISGDDELRRLAELREKFILDEESEREAVREEAREEGLAEGRT